jgi:hypothetical protein
MLLGTVNIKDLSKGGLTRQFTFGFEFYIALGDSSHSEGESQ